MSEPIEFFIQPILNYFDKLNNNLYTKSRKVTARDVFYHNMVATLNGDGIIDANIIFAIQADNVACPTA